MNGTAKNIVILICVLVTHNIIAQDTTFYKIIETVEGRTGREICEYEGRIFISASGICDQIYECTEVMEIDRLGNVIWQRRIPWLDRGSDVMIIDKDTITITGNHPEQDRFLMHHMTLAGDSLSTYEIRDTSDLYTNMYQLATVKHNGKYYLGGTGLRSDSSYSLIYIVSTEGELENLLIPHITNLNSDIWDMLIDQDGLVTAFIEADTDGIGEGHEPYRMIVKYNDAYEIVWSYTSEQDENNRDPTPEGTELHDGRIAYILNGEYWRDYSVRAINHDSTISWQYNWEYSIEQRNSRDLLKLYTTSDGGILAVGHGYIDGHKPGVVQSPYICKLSPDGDLLWDRYLIVTDTIKENVAIWGALFEVLELEDGSLYIIGDWRDHGFSDRDILLIRLDADGCLIPDCDYTMDGTVFCDIPKPTVIKLEDFIFCNEQNFSYQWLDCDDNYVAIDSATLRSYFPQSSGNFAVEISTPDGCRDTSHCTEYIITSTNIVYEEKVRIYPNPIIDGKLNISFIDLPFNSVKQINIYQAQGNLIDEIITTENLINIDFSIYPTGLYFLRVQNDKIVLLNKMIVKL